MPKATASQDQWDELVKKVGLETAGKLYNPPAVATQPPAATKPQQEIKPVTAAPAPPAPKTTSTNIPVYGPPTPKTLQVPKAPTAPAITDVFKIAPTPTSRVMPIDPVEVIRAQERALFKDVEGVSPEKQKLVAESIFGKVDRPLSYGGKTEVGSELIKPSAYVPRTEYPSVLSTLPYQELRRQDELAQKRIEAQGGGALDALRPRTLTSQYQESLARFDKRTGETIANLGTLVQDIDKYDAKQRQELFDFFIKQYSDQPETLEAYRGVLEGTVTKDNIGKVTDKLGQDLQKYSPRIAEGTLTGFKGPSGEIVESTPMYALRLLNVPSAVVGGGLEAAASATEELATKGLEATPVDTISNSIGRYVREGRGIADAGGQVAGRIGAAIGGEGSTAESALTLVGGLAGLAGDLALPSAFGKVAKGVSKAAGVVELATDVAINAPDISRAARALREAELAGDLAAAQTARAELAAAKQAVKTLELGKQFNPETPAVFQAVSKFEQTQDTNADELARVLIQSNPDPNEIEAVAPIARSLGLLDEAKGSNDISKVYYLKNTILPNIIKKNIDVIESKVPEADKAILSELMSGVLQAVPAEEFVKSGQFREGIKTALLKEAAQNNYVNALSTGIRNGKTNLIPEPIAAILTKDFVRITPDTFVPAQRAKEIIQDLTKSDNPIASLKVGELISQQVAKELIPVTKQLGLDLDPTVRVSQQVYDKILEAYLRKQARTSPFFIPTEKLAGAVQRLRAPMSTIRAQKLSQKLSTIADDIRATKIEQNLFVPSEIRTGIIGDAASAIRRSIYQTEEEASNLADPILKELYKEVGNAAGSIENGFKISLKQNLRDKTLTPREASFKTLVGNDPSEYFDEYLRTMYGANNVVGKVALAEKLTKESYRIPDSQRISSAIRRMVTEDPDLYTAKETFMDLYKAGRFVEAQEQLYKVHAVLQGRTIGSIIPEVAPSIEKHAPIYPFKDFVKLQGITYYTSKLKEAQQNILSKYKTAYPDRFNIDPNELDKWWTTFKKNYFRGKNSLPKPNLLAAMKIVDNGFQQIMEDPRIIEAAAKQDYANTLGSAFSKSFRPSNKLLLSYVVAKDSPNVVEETIANLNKPVQQLLIELDRKAATIGGAAGRDLETAVKYIDDVFTNNIDSSERIDDIRRLTSEEEVTFRRNSSRIPKSISRIDDAIESQKKALPPDTAAEELSKAYQKYGGVPIQGKLIDKAISNKVADDMMGLIIPAAGRVIPEAESIALKDAFASQIEELAAIANKLPKEQRTAIQTVLDFASDGFAKASGAARAGTLAGLWLPNPDYLMTNFLTAPLIILSTLGEEAATKATSKVMRGLVDEIGRAGGIAPKTTLGKILTSSRGNTQFLDDVITDVNGRQYRIGDLVDEITKRSITRSQAGAELAQNLFRDFERFAYTKVAGDGKLTPSANKTLTWIKNNFNPTRSGVWNEIGNWSDSMWRLSTFVDAIESGRGIDEAAKIARESLFDYGSLTKFEKQQIQKYIWFYTFWSRNLGTAVKNIVTNPQRLASTYRLKRALDITGEEDIDYQYSQNKAFKMLIQDPETKERLALRGPGIPAAEALTELIDDLSLLYVAGANATGMRSLDDNEIQQGISRGIHMLKPETKVAIATIFGIDPDRPDGKFSKYIEPRLAYWLQKTGSWDRFTSFVPVEKITDPEKMDKKYGIYNGVQYKIKPGYEKKYYLLYQSLLPIGIQRNQRQWADIVAPIAPLEKKQPVDIADWRLRWEGLWPYIFRSAGIVEPTQTPTQREAYLQQQKERLKILKQGQ